MIEPNHPTLPVVRQCALVGIRRSTYYGGPRVEKPENLALMGAIDEQFMETPWVTGPGRWPAIFAVPDTSSAASGSGD